MIDIEFEPYVVKEVLTPLPGASDVQSIVLHNHAVRNWCR